MQDKLKEKGARSDPAPRYFERRLTIMTFFNELISKTLKNRPIAKVLFLCVMAAYAATVFDVAKYGALSLEWCLYLAKGTAITGILICSPIVFYGTLINGIIEDAAIKEKTPNWLSDILFNIYRYMSVFLGIATWLIIVSVPALIISECGIIATGGAFDIEALWVSATGALFPETLIGGLLWLSRVFVIFYYLFCLLTPIKVKEEPAGKGIVEPFTPYTPKKISAEEREES